MVLRQTSARRRTERPYGTGVAVLGRVNDAFAEILNPSALEFLAELHRTFEPRRRELLDRRAVRQREIDAGQNPTFLEHTRTIRDSEWTAAQIPADLLDRRVEITGPVDRKMIINALNSGANVYMADFEDSNSPTWGNVVQGQLNLRDAVNRTIRYEQPDGKHYELRPSTATLMVRPRGWHLDERHVLVEEQPISAALFDFGLFFYYNAFALLARGSAPYFYLPKLENHLEARLWNDVFNFAQDYLEIPRGTIRATVLIENILAAFEMDEILWELRKHSAGLNCGRWDYIFSYIKTFRDRAGFVLPDREDVTMERHFLASYVDLLIETCHRRGVHAMGGMAAQIPIKGNAAANRRALQRVWNDKLREVTAGHDGTWVAHPGLVAIARDAFDQHMLTPNQIHRPLRHTKVTDADLLRVPQGAVTASGFRNNVTVGLRYLESWLRGSGCVPINHLMEDAATAEIARSQLWQWVHHGVQLANGNPITPELVRQTMLAELEELRAGLEPHEFAASQFPLAARIFERMITGSQLPDWLTSTAYRYLD